GLRCAVRFRGRAARAAAGRDHRGRPAPASPRLGRERLLPSRAGSVKTGPMRQIPLELSGAEPASFDNYVAGANGEALAVLRALAGSPDAVAAPAPRAASPAPRAVCRAVYLWG